MRVLIGISLLLGMACAVVAADEKIDVKKLMGKWKHQEQKFVIEFLKDGKFSIAGEKNGSDFKADGTYKVDGNKLLLNIKFGDEEKKMTRTVSKLTDTELTSKDDDTGKEDTLVRVKGKRKKKE